MTLEPLHLAAVVPEKFPSASEQFNFCWKPFGRGTVALISFVFYKLKLIC